MTPGKYQATIEENDLRFAGTGTEFVFLRVSIEGDSIPVQIWLSDKAMNMARAQLKLCGFEFGKDKLASLLEDPKYLAGRPIPVEIYEEEYNGKTNLKARIVTASLTKKRVAELDKKFTSGSSDDNDDIPF